MKVASLPAYAGSFISLCAVRTIAVDRLLAFYLAQRYREVVFLGQIYSDIIYSRNSHAMPYEGCKVMGEKCLHRA